MVSLEFSQEPCLTVPSESDEWTERIITVRRTCSLPLNTTLTCWITFCYFVAKASSYRDLLHILTWTAINLSRLRMKYVFGPN